MRRFAFILAMCFAATACGAEVSFQRDVWPVFKRHCAGCHGGQKNKGRLRLDDVASLLKGGKTGLLFVAGKPDDSLLITQVSGDKPDMPENEAPLSPAKVKLLRDWIAQGAKIDGAPISQVPPVVISATYSTAPAISSAAISPDGKVAAIACRSEVVMFNVDDDAPPRRLPTDFDLITHVEFSPDGKRLAAGGGSPQQFGGVIFFDPVNGTRQGGRRLGADTFFKGNFSPDGQSMAFGGANGAIHIIPVNEKEQPKTIEIHSDWVTAVAYSADGRQLVSGSRDKTTKISSVQGLRLLRSIDQSADVINAVAADPLTAFSGGNAATLTGYDFKLSVGDVETTGSGNSTQPVSKRDQYVRNFEVQAGAVMALGISGDRKLLAVATRTAEVRIYQTDTRTRKTAIPMAPAPVLAVGLNRDGSRLIVGGKTGEVQVWDTTSAKLIKSLVPVPVQQAANAGK